MKTLKNVSPLGAIDMPLLGRQGEPFDEHGAGCLEPGETFEVSDEIAGRAPSWSTNADGVEVYDAGEGLLAQTGNFELVTTAPAPKAKAATTDENKDA